MVSPARLLGQLLDRPDAREVVQRMPSVQLNQLVSQVGVADTGELIALATADQLRDLVDLQVWTGDRVDVDELLDWVCALISAPTADPMAAARHLDIELLGLLLLRHARIYLLADGGVPEQPRGHVHPTPDGWFALDIDAEGDRVAQLVQVIDACYADDQDATRRLLQNLLWELPDELEEAAHRWRSGRLADLGFADPVEALRVYAHLDPRSVSPDEQTADGALGADPEPVGVADLVHVLPHTESSFWTRGIELVDAEERERLARAAMALANLVLSADRVSPGDPDLGRDSLEALHWRLSLGLEHLCRGLLERAPAVLAGVALQRIARVGHSLLLDLRRRLLDCARQRGLGRQPSSVDLLDLRDRQRLSPLLSQRPRFFDESTGCARPLRDLAELRAADRWVELARLAAALVPPAARPEPIPVEVEVTLGDLFRTTLANRLLARPDLEPIDRDALAALLLIDGCDSSARSVLDTASALAAQRLGESSPGVDRELLDELLGQWLAEFDQLARLRADELDLRFVAGLHLRRA